MEAKDYWALFCATGDPLAYMMYRRDMGRETPEENQHQE